MNNECEFSECRKYRYTLRHIRNRSVMPVQFIGLNPSTADEKNLDPTLRRCVNFAERWGYGGIIMTNIFAVRHTDPMKMRGVKEPVGEANDFWLRHVALNWSVITVACWGNHGSHMGRDIQVIDLFKSIKVNLYCIGRGKLGTPKHPLYLKEDARLERF